VIFSDHVDAEDGGFFRRHEAVSVEAASAEAALVVASAPAVLAAGFTAEPWQVADSVAVISTMDTDDIGDCYVVQRRIHTRQGWSHQPVQVCG
jgi:hypothetical protein